MEYIRIKMGIYTKGCGKMINNMDKVKKFHLMARGMKENSKKGRNQGKDASIGLINLIISGNGSIINNQAMEFNIGTKDQKAVNTMANGKTIACTAMGN